MRNVDAKARYQAEFRWKMRLRRKLALRIHMLLERKVCPEIIGGRSVADENPPFTAKISFFAGRVE